MEKSRDAFRTISEVADWLGTPTHVLRFWESRFPQVKPVKRAGGRRYYRPADMELLGGIKKLLHDEGLTIRGVQKILREEGVKHVSSLSHPIEIEGAMTLFPSETDVTPSYIAGTEPSAEVPEARMITDAQPEPETDNVVSLSPLAERRTDPPKSHDADESAEESSGQATSPAQEPAQDSPDLTPQTDASPDSLPSAEDEEPAAQAGDAESTGEKSPKVPDTDTTADAGQDENPTPADEQAEEPAEEPTDEPVRKSYSPVYAAPFSRTATETPSQPVATDDSRDTEVAAKAEDAEPTSDDTERQAQSDPGFVNDEIPEPDPAPPAPKPARIPDPMAGPAPAPFPGDELIARLQSGATLDRDALRPVYDRLAALKAKWESDTRFR